MLNKKALAGTAGAAKEYVEDVFSTWLYTGNGSSQTITNGIDLAGKGGMVWIKGRTANTQALSHVITDSGIGNGYWLDSASTSQSNYSANIVTRNSNGFTTSSSFRVAQSGDNFASWTFRKQLKFFDVVTYTGNGSNRTIAHNLGSVPGMIIVKRTDTTEDWQVYHRSLANTEYLVLNTTAAKATGTTRWNSTTPTSTVFSLGTDTTVNANGGTYVAYLFAHDAGGFGAAGTDNIITCGIYTGNGATNGGPVITLGYEPQYVLIKRASDGTGSWVIHDSMIGLTSNNAGAVDYSNVLLANDSGAEGPAQYIKPTATGFDVVSPSSPVNTNGSTYIYMAIRRPMKTPTSGASVFSPTVYTGTNADNRLVNTGILTDMVMIKERNDTVAGMVTGDRLRGDLYLLTGTTSAEVNDANSLMTTTSGYGNAFSAMNGVGVGNDATSKVNIDTTSNNHIAWAFKRAPGFFDVVCYTGDGVARTVNHNLGVAPELMIVKSRSNTTGWFTYSAANGASNYLQLNLTDSLAASTNVWNDTVPTAQAFTVGGATGTNGSGRTLVAYLFASCPGVSKVGSYTGNGSNQTINCGFSAGARFVLIKRTDSTGDWYVFDTARGIVSGNDPFLLLNSTAAEVTTRDAVDPDNSGFIVNNDATNFPINVNNATYIYLAIA